MFKEMRDNWTIQMYLYISEWDCSSLCEMQAEVLPGEFVETRCSGGPSTREIQQLSVEGHPFKISRVSRRIIKAELSCLVSSRESCRRECCTVVIAPVTALWKEKMQR
jgi:hypothetical protein